MHAFSKFVIKIHKLTSLEYKPVLCVLTKNFDSYNSFFQTQQWQDMILFCMLFQKLLSKSRNWLLLSMNQFYECWYRSLIVTAVSSKHISDKMLYSWMNFQKLLDQNPETDFFRVGTSYVCWSRSFTVTAVFPKHNSDKI